MADPQQDSFDDYETIENEDGSVDLIPPPEQEEQDYVHDENLAELLEDDYLDGLAVQVIDGYEADKQSRKPWEDTIVTGLTLLGLKIEEQSEPFEGACGATHPLILEACVKFQAKASKELFPVNGPVKTQVLGKKTEEKMAQANRVQTHMNWQLNEQIEEYFPDMESALLYIPCVGLAFKKMVFSECLGRPAPEFVPADHLVVPANAVDLRRAPRYTQLIFRSKNDMLIDQSYGIYRDIELGACPQVELPEITRKFNDLIGLTSSVSEEDEVYTLLEQHVDLDLPEPYGEESGIARPYIVTVDKGTQKVLAIRRNWKQEDPKKQKRVWFVKYPFVPGFGFYSLGLLHLLGNFELTLTAIMRSMVDAGQFANMQGGWKAKGMKIVGDNAPFRPGEWKDVEATGMDLQKSILPLQYKEPSQVLFAMLQYLEGRGQQFADNTEQVISDATNYGPVGTTNALLEASTKFFSGVHKRLHYAQKQEFKLLAEINGENVPDEGYPFEVVGGEQTIYAQDYGPAVDVVPASDPNVASNAHRIQIVQTKMQLSRENPGMMNQKLLVKELLMAIDPSSDVNELVPPDAAPEPLDPVSDIISAVSGKPIKAFPGQDHDSHIKIKTLWLQDPQNGKNPIMAGAGPVLQANIREHMVLRYQALMAGAVQTLGVSPEGVNDMVVSEAAKLVAHANAVKGEIDGTKDPLQIAAEAQMLEAQADLEKVKADREKNMMKNEVDKETLALKAVELRQKGVQFDKKIGADLIDKATSRIQDAHLSEREMENRPPKPKA